MHSSSRLGRTKLRWKLCKCPCSVSIPLFSLVNDLNPIILITDPVSQCYDHATGIRQLEDTENLEAAFRKLAVNMGDDKRRYAMPRLVIQASDLVLQCDPYTLIDTDTSSGLDC